MVKYANISNSFYAYHVFVIKHKLNGLTQIERIKRSLLKLRPLPKLERQEELKE